MVNFNIIFLIITIIVGYWAIGAQIARVKKVNKKQKLDIDEIFSYVFFWPVGILIDFIVDYVNRPDNNR